MATYDAASYADEPYSRPGELCARYGEAEDANLASDGDEVNFFKMPNRTRVLFGSVQCEDLDSNGTPTLVFDVKMTDGSTTYTLASGLTIGQGGGQAFFDVAASLMAKTDSDDFRLYIEVTTDAATAQSGKYAINVGYVKGRETGDGV